jgi:hypothetical protein
MSPAVLLQSLLFPIEGGFSGYFRTFDCHTVKTFVLAMGIHPIFWIGGYTNVDFLLAVPQRVPVSIPFVYQLLQLHIICQPCQEVVDLLCWPTLLTFTTLKC